MTPTGAEAVSDVVRAAPGRGTLPFARIGIGFAATAIVTILITRVARRALREATGQ